MDVDVAECLPDLSQMPIESRIGSFVGPSPRNLVGGISKDGAEPIFNLNVRTEVSGNLFKPDLGRIGPNTEDVREIFD